MKIGKFVIVEYATTKLQKTLTSEIALRRTYGDRRAREIQKRLSVLYGAMVLADFVPRTRPERCHELVGNRAGQLAMDIDKGTRLIFKPLVDPIPRRSDGGMDWNAIDAIIIIEIVNYHE